MNEIVLYRPGTSFFHKCDSRVKLFILAVYTVLAFLFYNPVLPAILLVSSLILNFLSIGSYMFKTFMFKMIFVIMGFLLILHGFVNPAGVTPALFFGHTIRLPYFGYYTMEGFYLGLVFWLRLSAVLLVAMIYVTTTSPTEMMSGLQKMGVPFKFCFMLSMSFQLIPISTREAKIIASAQRARGLSEKTIIDKFKGLVPMFVPLVVSSLDRMETLSMALESRAFGYSKKPTEMSDIHLRKADFIILGIGILLLLSAIVIRVRYGSLNWVTQVKTWKDVFYPGIEWGHL